LKTPNATVGPRRSYARGQPGGKPRGSSLARSGFVQSPAQSNVCAGPWVPAHAGEALVSPAEFGHRRELEELGGVDCGRLRPRGADFTAAELAQPVLSATKRGPPPLSLGAPVSG
jgi:hypothetical protein